MSRPPMRPAPMALRPAARTAATLTLALLAACGGDRPGADEPRALALSSTVPFCEPVVAAVRAWYGEQAERHPLPDDPRYGGTVVVAGGGDLLGGLLSFTTADQTTQETELHLVHTTLLRLDADLAPRPYLAESWEVHDDDGGVTFRLRDDLYWHDGRPVTVDDVAFTFRRAMDPATGFTNSAWFHQMTPEGIEVVDERTIRFDYPPHAESLHPFANLPIMPVHLLGDVPPEELRDHPFATECPVGSGPYLFESMRAGDQWVLRANPGFPEALGGRPFLDRYVYRVITSSATRAGELAAGGVDVALSLEPADAPMVEGNPALRLAAIPSRSYAFVGWNTRLPQLSDARVRTALAMATDRGTLVETLRGAYGTVAETGIPDFHWAHDPDLVGPPHDPARARALLDEAGWVDRDGDGVRENADGLPLRIAMITNANTERESIGRVLVDQLAAVGVEVDFRVLDVGALQQRVMVPGARDFGALIMGFSPDFNIDETTFFHSDAVDHPFGWSALADPEIDRLLDTLPLIPSREEALPYWAEYQERIVEAQPFMYLYYSLRLNGVRAELAGVEFDRRGDLMEAARWYRDPAGR